MHSTTSTITTNKLFWLMQSSFFTMTGIAFISHLFFNTNTYIFTVQGQILSFISTGLFLTFLVLIFLKMNAIPLSFIYLAHGLILAIQIGIATQLEIDFLHDLIFIADNARVTNDLFTWPGYFSTYPNNFILFFFFRSIYGLLNVLGLGAFFHFVLVTTSLLAVNLSLILVFHVVKLFFGNRQANISWLLALCLIAPNSLIFAPYTDTLSMPFLMGQLYLYGKLLQRQDKFFATAFVLGMLGSIGFLIKPTTMIPLIAITIIELIKDAEAWFHQKNTSQKDKQTMLSIHLLFDALLGFLLIHMMFQLFIRFQSVLPFDPDIAFPAEHWIKMGLTTRYAGHGRYIFGGYYADDFFFMHSFATTAEMRTAARLVIGERLQAFGFLGYLEFLLSKGRWITSDGLFAGTGLMSIGEISRWYRYLFQGIWATTLFMIVGQMFFKQNHEHRLKLVTICSLIGIMLQILLMEASPRYLINHLPLFAILASFFIRECESKLNRPSKPDFKRDQP